MCWFVLLLEEAEDLIYLVGNYIPVLVLLVCHLALSFSICLRIVFFVLFNFPFPAFSFLGLQLEMFLFLFLTAWLSVVWEDDRRVGNFLNSLALHSLNISLIWIFTQLSSLLHQNVPFNHYHHALHFISPIISRKMMNLTKSHKINNKFINWATSCFAIKRKGKM